MYQVTKVYQNQIRALDQINLNIGKGEFVFLVGPSGAGKTTLMRMIFREDVPTAGSILIDGRNIERLSSGAVPYLRRSIGVVLQDFRLLPEMTAFENVAFAMRVVEARTQDIESRTSQVLDMMGLSHKKHHFPRELSGGEQQRVCIARALVNDPAILLTDEPTGNLDPELSYEIMKVLLDINGRGTTVMVATHDLNLVHRIQRRVIHLQGGRIIKDTQKKHQDED